MVFFRFENIGQLREKLLLDNPPKLTEVSAVFVVAGARGL
jgi:hypothetical protein